MTNPSKLEQVARAIAQKVRPTTPNAAEHVEEWSLMVARAAIAAMELPTEEMVAEVADGEVDVLGSPIRLWHLSRDETAAAYSQMIRAALKEEK